MTGSHTRAVVERRITSSGAELCSALLSCCWGAWLVGHLPFHAWPGAAPWAPETIAPLILGTGLLALGLVQLVLLLSAAPMHLARVVAAIVAGALWIGVLWSLLQGWTLAPGVPTAAVCISVNAWSAFTLAMIPRARA